MKKRKLFIGLVTASLILSVCGCQNSDSETYTADEIIQSAYDINIDDYKTVHHEAETHEETITKHVCKKCGHVKED